MAEESLIQSLKSCGAIQYGRFVLTSGAESDYYIDIKKASTHPQTLKLIAQQMKPYTQQCELLAGMELGAVPLVVALSLETNIPYVIIRKNIRDHGTAKQIEGGDINGKKILIVEDVTTSGGSVEKTINIIKKYHGEITKIVTVVDRECGATELFMQYNIPFSPLVRVSDLIKK